LRVSEYGEYEVTFDNSLTQIISHNWLTPLVDEYVPSITLTWERPNDTLTADDIQIIERALRG